MNDRNRLGDTPAQGQTRTCGSGHSFIPGNDGYVPFVGHLAQNPIWNFHPAIDTLKPGRELASLIREKGTVSRTNFDGKPIRRVLSWLTNRDLTDADLALALNMPTTTFSRRKEEESFPSYEEISMLADHFGVCPKSLHISFGHLDIDALVLLDEKGMWQYLEQGGGNHPHPTMPVVRSRIGQVLSHEHWSVTYGDDNNVHSL